MLALMLIASAPDVVEGCAAQALRYRAVSAAVVAEACRGSVVNGQLDLPCARVLNDGQRIAALMRRGVYAVALARHAGRIAGNLSACRAGRPVEAATLVSALL